MNKQEAIEKIKDLYSFVMEDGSFEVDLINKNQAECSAKTPNFPASRQRPLQRGALADPLRRRAKGKPPCVSVGAQRQQLRFSGRSERRSDRRRSSRPDPGPCVFTSR